MIEKFNYFDIKIPNGYVCHICRVSGCKLWRDYNLLAFKLPLMCYSCAAKSQAEDISDIDDAGEHTSIREDKTDWIGWLVPAIPTEDGRTFWGYTLAPDKAKNWWKKLPTKPL